MRKGNGYNRNVVEIEIVSFFVMNLFTQLIIVFTLVFTIGQHRFKSVLLCFSKNIGCLACLWLVAVFKKLLKN